MGGSGTIRGTARVETCEREENIGGLQANVRGVAQDDSGWPVVACFRWSIGKEEEGGYVRGEVRGIRGGGIPQERERG